MLCGNGQTKVRHAGILVVMGQSLISLAYSPCFNKLSVHLNSSVVFKCSLRSSSILQDSLFVSISVVRVVGMRIWWHLFVARQMGVLCSAAAFAFFSTYIVGKTVCHTAVLGWCFEMFLGRDGAK